MTAATIIATERSAAWDGPAPSVSVVIATFNREGFLRELVAALEGQDLPRDQLEVVLVDNGSRDGTWDQLRQIAQATSLRLLLLRVEVNQGPAPGRNAGVAASRGEVVAITDDDCLPTPGWAGHLRTAFDGGADIVQGTVVADPAGLAGMGPWDHTIWVTAPTPFFETCNVAYRRTAFDRAGGFDEDDPLLHPPSGRAFGEDACLAWEVQRTGGTAAFSEQAVVHHRCIPSTYARWLTDQRQLERFPGLARRSPLVARWLHMGVFLEPRSRRFDLAVGAVIATVAAVAVTRSPWPLLLMVLMVPWVRDRWGNSRHRVGGDRRAAVGVFGRLAWSDAVGLACMLRGSLRYRRLVI
jgi:GT2 family glycosyltransferase